MRYFPKVTILMFLVLGLTACQGSGSDGDGQAAADAASSDSARFDKAPSLRAQGEDVYELLEQADELYYSGKYTAALEVYGKIVALDPERKGFSFLRKYRPPEPYYVAEAPSEEPNLDELVEARGLYKTLLQDYLRTSPSDLDAIGDLALIDREAGETMLATHLAQNPDHTEGHRVRFDLLMAQGEFLLALTVIERVIELEPDQPQHHLKHGVALFEAVQRLELPESERLLMLRRSGKVLEHAATLDGDDIEALVYRRLVILEEAKLESDPDRRAALEAEAAHLLERVRQMTK